MLKPVALLTPRPSPSRDRVIPDWLLAGKLEPPLPRADAWCVTHCWLHWMKRKHAH